MATSPFKAPRLRGGCPCHPPGLAVCGGKRGSDGFLDVDCAGQPFVEDVLADGDRFIGCAVTLNSVHRVWVMAFLPLVAAACGGTGQAAATMGLSGRW